MPANVETMMWTGSEADAPWHGLGKRLPIDVPSDMAIVESGLNWTVKKEPIILSADGKSCPDHMAIVRQSDRSVLSVQSKSYEPFQNDALFAFGDALVGTGATYHTAGSLDGGRRVWALMKTEGAIQLLKGESVEKYLMLATSHDGSLAFTSAFTGVRVVCSNTLAMALEGAKDKVSIRHTCNLQDRVKQAQQIMGLSGKYFGRFEEVATALVKAPYSDSMMVELTESLFPVKEGKDEVPTRTLNNRATVIDLFTTGRGHDRIRGTAWAALNAVTEYTDHHATTRNTDRGTSQENRMSSIFWGGTAKMRQAAFTKITEQTGLKLAA